MGKLRLGSTVIPQAILPGSGTPTYTNLTVIPSTSQQLITVPSGYNGYNQITVNAVNSSIDANITAGNIKRGVTILGTTGNYGSELQFRYIERNLVTNNKLTYPSIILQTQGIKELGESVLCDAYHNNIYLQGEVCFPELTVISGNNAAYNCFCNCTNITSVNLSSLVIINGPNSAHNCFHGCTNLTSVNLCNLTTIIGWYAMEYAFCCCPSLTSINLSNLTFVNQRGLERTFINVAIPSINLCNLTTVNSGGLLYTFGYCNNLTSVNLSKLSFVGGNALEWTFWHCNNLTTISFPSLVNITTSGSLSFNETFRDCPNLRSVYFNNLTTVSATNTFLNTFKNCTNLTTMNFPMLSVINKGNAFRGCFDGCTALSSIYFPALTSSSFGTVTTQFNSMLVNVNNCVVHFPSSVRSTINTWSDVTGGFGGTNCRAAFDLPATS